MHEQYLREAIRLALEGSQAGFGGPFGAVIVRDGQVSGQGCNQVLATSDPTAHAEVVAIRAACRKLGQPHLTGCTIYASCEPCPMCLAACYWAQVGDIYYGATAADAAAAGFADDFIRRDLLLPPAERRLLLQPLLRTEALAPFIAWQANVDRQHYGPTI